MPKPTSPVRGTSRLSPLFFGALGLCALATLGNRAVAADWPTWRGPDGNRISAETGLPDNWDTKPGDASPLVWRKENLAGRSTPVVLGDRLYLIVRDQPETELEGEKVVCVNAATGETLWEHRFNVYLSDVPDTRVGWSSVTADPETGNVYAQGVCGYFCCLNGASGDVIWSRSLHEEFGLLSTYGGRTNFPLIYEDTVITSAVVIGWGDSPKWNLLAKPAHRFMAFDKATGELRWLSGTRLIPYDTTYSTPVLTELDGQEALVFGSGDGAAWAMQPGTGKLLWKCQLSRRGLNVSPAIGPEGKVYIGHSEENTTGNAMGAFVAIDGSHAGGNAKPDDKTDKELWKNYQQMVGKSSPIYYEGAVYAVTDGAKLLAIDPESGETLAQKKLGRVMRGSPLVADGKIYVCSRGGRWQVIRPVWEGGKLTLETVGRGSFRREQVDASPIAAGGRMYVTTSAATYCFASAERPAAAPAAEQETAAPEITDKRVAQVQVVPWDVLLSPGQEQAYKLRLFNEAGQFLREADPEKVSFGVAGSGGISKRGVYKAPAGSAHQTAQVLTEFNGMKAKARVRIVPSLPWSFDFENGAKDVPLTWVGGRVRYVLREDAKGNHHLAKPTELPTRPGKPTTKLGTRSRMWMGSPDLANYTVQADIQLQEGVAGESAGEADPEGPPAVATAIKLPTAGLINSGYTFALFGPSQEARLYSWCTHDKRTQAAEAMELKAGVWYRMKLVVVPKPAERIAIVQAKVWPRGEAEPGQWTLRFEDQAPNLSGSPGLFGDAKEAEFYVDNLKVIPN